MNLSLRMFRRLIRLLPFIILGCDVAKAQNIDLSLGVGSVEGFNVAARYGLRDYQFGIGVGTGSSTFGGPLPLEGRPVSLIFSGSAYWHPLGKSKLSVRRPWFVKGGLTYDYYGNDFWNMHSWLGNFYLGREFNFSKKLGCSLALGIAGRFYNKVDEKQTTYTFPENDTFIGGGYEFNIFYRLWTKVKI